MRTTRFTFRRLLLTLLMPCTLLCSYATAGVITQTRTVTGSTSFAVDIGESLYTDRIVDINTVGFDLFDRSRGRLTEVIFEQSWTGILNGIVNNRYQDGGSADVELNFTSQLLGGSTQLGPRVRTNVTALGTSIRVAPGPGETAVFNDVSLVDRTVTQRFVGADASLFVGVLSLRFDYTVGLGTIFDAVETGPLGLFCAEDGRPADVACITSIGTGQRYANNITLTYLFDEITSVNEPSSVWLLLVAASGLILRKQVRAFQRH